MLAREWRVGVTRSCNAHQSHARRPTPCSNLLRSTSRFILLRGCSRAQPVLLEALDGGARTKVTLVTEVHSRGAYETMEPMMRWVAQRQLSTQLRTLKNLLESESFREASS